MLMMQTRCIEKKNALRAGLEPAAPRLTREKYVMLGPVGGMAPQKCLVLYPIKLPQHVKKEDGKHLSIKRT